MMINLIAATREDWAKLLNGPLHEERQRFYAPGEVDQDLVDARGYPVLVKLGDGTVVHVYAPRTAVPSRKEDLEELRERADRVDRKIAEAVKALDIAMGIGTDLMMKLSVRSKEQA